jgi:predicted porin
MNPIRASLLMSSLAAAGVAQAQTAPAPATAPATTAPVVVTKTEATSLTWSGITLYGIVDIGLQYQNHGAPISDYFPGGTLAIIAKNSHQSVTGLTPNNLSQSRIGLSGLEPIGGDFSFVFRLETFFNPQSGELSDGIKSLAQNNGKPLNQQNTAVDSSVAGQIFAGAAYAGVSSPTFGTLTIGRHVTPLADGVAKYDPMGAAQAFSVVGTSGTAAGGGATEDRRLDDSVKYTVKIGPVHAGALYQFNGASGQSNTAFQGTLGFELAGGSLDGYYAKKKGAIAASPLSPTQADQLAGVGTPAAPACNTVIANAPPPGLTPVPPPCVSIDTAVAATISDNTTYSVMGLYSFGAPKIYAGYEHIKFENPENPIAAGASTIGGYVLAFTNNKAYTSAKTVDVIWAGAKYAVTDKLEFTGAYYGYRQDAFATGANAGCNSAVSSACKGELDTFSLLADYKLTKRFDVYLGSIWSEVKNGLANGYVELAPGGNSASAISTTTGVRFRF